MVAAVQADNTACKQGRARFVILGGIKRDRTIASALRIGRSTVPDLSPGRAVVHTYIANCVFLIGGYLISKVCIYLVIKCKVAVIPVGRKVHVDGCISRRLQEADAVRIAFARLEVNIRDIIGRSAFNGNFFVLFIENINAVDVVILIPLVKVVSNHLTKARQRYVTLGSYAAARLNEQILCLDGLCVITLFVVGYEQPNPLRCVLGARVQIHDLSVNVSNGLVKSKYGAFHELGGNSVIGGLAERDLLDVVQILGHGVIVPVDLAVDRLLNNRNDVGNGNCKRNHNKHDQECPASADCGAELHKACKNTRGNGFSYSRAENADQCDHTHRDLGNAHNRHA